MDKDKLQNILQIVAKKYSVRPSDILSSQKTRAISRARHILMWKLKQYGYSSSYIGRILRKNHATVLLACKKINSDPILLNEAENTDIDVSSLQNNIKKKEKTYTEIGKWRKIFGKYRAICQICGFEDIVEVHHIIPAKNGGSHSGENILILCSNHHKMLHMGMLHIENIKSKELITAP